MTALPWLPFLASDYLEREVLLPRFRVFEWGSGDSTRWLAARCQYVVTVDHDLKWQQGLPGNVVALTIPPEPGEIGPDPSNPEHYRSGSTELGPGHNWRKYVEVIEGYGIFDLILVDGRARASCIWHAVDHVVPGGWLVVDNTGDRPWYLAKTIRFLEGWDRVTFFGRGPTLVYPWECSMFRKPREA